MVTKAYQFLGSIKLAVPLLSAIAVILIGATFYENQVGATLVQAMIYKSPWFGGLMFLLALNLGVSALSRYPWRGARKIGFALTHFGIIVLIAGAAAVIHLGAEGLIVLRTDGPALHELRVEGDLLEVIGTDGQPQQVPVQVHADQAVSPATVGELALLDSRDRVVNRIEFADTGTVANAAVQVQLTSQRMGQNATEWLAQFPQTYQQTRLGPVTLELVQAHDHTELDQYLATPAPPDLGRWGDLTLQMGEQTQTFDIEQQLGQVQTLSDGTALTISQFWPDFRLDDHDQPVSASETLQNPAVQVAIATPDTTTQWYVFAQPGFAPIPIAPVGDPVPDLEALGVTLNYQTPPPVDRRFQVVVGPDAERFYTVRSAQGFQTGPLNVGVPVATGWADFQITLTDAFTHAQVQRQIIPANSAEDGVPGLLVQTNTEQPQWLMWGEPTEIPTQTGSVFALLSPRSLALPFELGLDDFVVDRNEGTDSVAMWTSKIRIVDPHSGDIEHRSVWMNHPTWYQGWKIAQASWNPGDLSQSTLQVKREPTWVTALTWSGALLVVSGIGVMFYGPQVQRWWRRMTPPLPT